MSHYNNNFTPQLNDGTNYLYHSNQMPPISYNTMGLTNRSYPIKGAFSTQLPAISDPILAYNNMDPSISGNITYQPSRPNFALYATPKVRKRAFSKRSKTGCLTCRERRIKCDETKPICNNCAKSKRCCVYQDPKESKLKTSKSKPPHVSNSVVEPLSVPIFPGKSGVIKKTPILPISPEAVASEAAAAAAAAAAGTLATINENGSTVDQTPTSIIAPATSDSITFNPNLNSIANGRSTKHSKLTPASPRYSPKQSYYQEKKYSDESSLEVLNSYAPDRMPPSITKSDHRCSNTPNFGSGPSSNTNYTPQTENLPYFYSTQSKEDLNYPLTNSTFSSPNLHQSPSFSQQKHLHPHPHQHQHQYQYQNQHLQYQQHYQQNSPALPPPHQYPPTPPHYHYQPPPQFQQQYRPSQQQQQQQQQHHHPPHHHHQKHYCQKKFQQQHAKPYYDYYETAYSHNNSSNENISNVTHNHSTNLHTGVTNQKNIQHSGSIEHKDCDCNSFLPPSSHFENNLYCQSQQHSSQQTLNY